MTEQDLVNIYLFKYPTLLGMMDRGELYMLTGNGIFVKMPYSKYILNKAIHLGNVFAEKIKVGE
jgi:hypothetical protein